MNMCIKLKFDKIEILYNGLILFIETIFYFID